MVNIVRGCILGICFFGSCVISIKANDSLTGLLRKTSEKDRVRLLNQLAEVYAVQSPAQSLEYGKQAFDLATRLRDEPGQTQAQLHIGTYYLYNGKYDKAQTCFEQALKLAKSLKNSGLQASIFTQFASLWYTRGKYKQAQQYALCAFTVQNNRRILPVSEIARLQSLLGNIYRELGQPEKSLSYTLQALQLRKELTNPREIAQSLNDMGDFYFSQRNLRKSLYNYLESLRIARQGNNRYSIAASLDRIGQIYLIQKRFQEALLYFQEALSMSQELEIPSQTAQVYLHMGETQLALHASDNAFQYYDTSLRIYSEQQNDLYMGTVLNKIGELYTQKKQYQKALSYHFQALHKIETSEAHLRKIQAYQSLANTYLSMNDSPNFMTYYRLYTHLQDSLLGETQLTIIHDLHNRLEQQEREIINSRERKWQQAELEKEKTQHMYLLIIVIVGTILGLTVIAFYLTHLRASQRLKQQNTIITHRNRQLHRVNAAQKSLNAKLMESETELRKTNEAKDKFFSIIAHDLRAPLATFSSFLTTLSDNDESFTPGEIEFITKSTQKSLKNLTGLLNNLLQWSRSQMGQLHFHPLPLVVKELASQTLSLFMEESKNKGITLTEDISPDAIVFADPNMLDFVVRNLVSNAIKFTTRGGSIHLTSVPVADPHKLGICVADTGIGIPPENLQKLFSLRTGFTTTGTANEKGTGLGLVLCKEFVEKNGGEIAIDSEPGKGSRFTLTLPKHMPNKH